MIPIQLHREHRGPQSSRRHACFLAGSTRKKGLWFERKTCLCYLRFLLFKKFEKKIVRSPKNTQSLAGLPNLCDPLCPLCNFLLYPNHYYPQITQINTDEGGRGVRLVRQRDAAAPDFYLRKSVSSVDNNNSVSFASSSPNPFLIPCHPR